MMAIDVAAGMGHFLQGDRVYDVTVMDVGVAACMSHCVSQ